MGGRIICPSYSKETVGVFHGVDCLFVKASHGETLFAVFPASYRKIHAEWSGQKLCRYMSLFGSFAQYTIEGQLEEAVRNMLIRRIEEAKCY